MLKFGIFTHRNNEFKIDDIDDLFSFLCHILDIFTNRKDYIELLSLDSIAQKDEIIEGKICESNYFANKQTRMVLSQLTNSFHHH